MAKTSVRTGERDVERHSGKLHPAGVEMKTVIRATDIRSSSSTDASGFKGEVCNVFVPLMTPNRIAKISDALKSWQIKYSQSECGMGQNQK